MRRGSRPVPDDPEFHQKRSQVQAKPPTGDDAQQAWRSTQRATEAELQGCCQVDVASLQKVSRGSLVHRCLGPGRGSGALATLPCARSAFEMRPPRVALHPMCQSHQWRLQEEYSGECRRLPHLNTVHTISTDGTERWLIQPKSAPATNAGCCDNENSSWMSEMVPFNDGSQSHDTTLRYVASPETPTTRGSDDWPPASTRSLYKCCVYVVGSSHRYATRPQMCLVSRRATLARQ